MQSEVKPERISTADIVRDPTAAMSQPSCACCGSAPAAFQCSQCKSAKYCSTTCQREGWKEHKVLCNSIHQLSESLYSQPTMFNSHLTPAKLTKLVKLVGEKCNMDCELAGEKRSCLMDSGSQICGVGSDWLKENLPGEKIRDISELLDEPLLVRTANKSVLPYRGWVSLPFKFGNIELDVPFLVCDSKLERPIIGFNVM